MKNSMLAAFIVLSLSRATFAGEPMPGAWDVQSPDLNPVQEEQGRLHDQALIADAVVLVDMGVPITYAVTLVKTADELHYQMMLAGLTPEEAVELVQLVLPSCLPDTEEVVASELGVGTGAIVLAGVFYGISKAIADYGDTWGPTDSGGKTESTDDEGSGDSNSGDGGSDGDSDGSGGGSDNSGGDDNSSD
ncbi:MAG: hypothetical protein ACR2NI_02930 [Pirellulales bacterium]